MASEKIALATIFTGIGAAEFAAHEVFGECKMLFACELDKFARLSRKLQDSLLRYSDLQTSRQRYERECRGDDTETNSKNQRGRER